MKNRVTIHMGANTFTVDVRGANGQPVRFDINKMDKKAQAQFRKELCIAFREASLT